MAYLRQCLQELRRYQGDPHWQIAFTPPHVLRPQDAAGAGQPLGGQEYEPLRSDEPAGFEGLRLTKRRPWWRETVLATADHNV